MIKLNFKNFRRFMTYSAIFLLCSVPVLSYNIPDNAVIEKKEEISTLVPSSLRWIVQAKSDRITRETYIEKNNPEININSEATAYLAGIVPIKKVNITYTDDIYLVPGGEPIGINIKTQGIMVVSIAPFVTDENEMISPGKNAGIQPGDIIAGINGRCVNKISELVDTIQKESYPLNFEIKRKDKKINLQVIPKNQITDKIPKIGIKIRESVSGLGTISYYRNNEFGALGHGICEESTGDKIPLKYGSIYPATITGIDKGKKGAPGSVHGVFSGDETGKILKNTDCGIFGNTKPSQKEKLPLGKTNDIHCGKAHILLSLDGSSQNFEIEIQRVMPHSTTSKGMVIEIKDKTLLEKTGGIVQGMSGAPIIQDGKLIGAITHVFVNNPKRGYGIFIENMLNENISDQR